MSRVARLLHLDDGEFPALRAQIEAKPVARQATPKPLGWGPAMLAFLRKQDTADTTAAGLGMRRPSAPIEPPPIVLTDWQARIAADWQDVNARLDKLNFRIAAEQIGLERSHGVVVCMLTQPLFAELAEFAAELDDDRAAAFADIHAERALIAELLERIESLTGVA